MNELVKVSDKYKVDSCALQATRWPGKGTLIKMNCMILNSGQKSDKHEFGTGFCIIRHSMDNLLDFEPVNERIC